MTRIRKLKLLKHLITTYDKAVILPPQLGHTHINKVFLDLGTVTSLSSYLARRTNWLPLTLKKRVGNSREH